jgi:predicted lipoprotein
MKTNFIGQINGEQFNSKEAFINKLNELGIKDVNFDNILNTNNNYINILQRVNQEEALKQIFKQIFPWYIINEEQNDEKTEQPKERISITQEELDKIQNEVFKDFIKLHIKSSKPIDPKNIEAWSEETLDEVSSMLYKKQKQFEDKFNSVIVADLQYRILSDIRNSKDFIQTKIEGTLKNILNLKEQLKKLEDILNSMNSLGYELPEKFEKDYNKLVFDIKMSNYHYKKFYLIISYYETLECQLSELNVQ